ncbi:hypothetical protein RI129_001381 [Pyrocoelia pectoralis]|uniref:Uncharacterized protein n=1 Tax=Pyrocoelia pectoralis TaxID=417401 RepID=A0AAN7VKM9_9COLE
MAFNFGSTSTTFGTPQNKPTAYGTPLSFGTPATAPQTGFGGFGSTFGTATQQPTFGAPATQQAAFGTTPSQPTGFGSSFGQPAAAAPAPAFGSTFGQTSTPAFGATFGTAATSTGFGTFGTATASAPAFGSTFGTAATSAPAFGSTFGTTTSTAPAFGTAFGATGSSAPNLFGTPAVTKPGLFGTPATTASSLFGTPSTAPSLFGTTSATQAPSLFGSTATSGTTNLFGTTSTAPSLFNTSFGATTTTTPSLFGASGTTGFGLGTTTASNTGFGLFGTGAATTSAPSLFGGFGKATTTGSTFTGFGTSAPGFTGFGTSTSAAPNWGAGTTFSSIRPPGPLGTVQPPQLQQTLASFYAINIFGDERDIILKKWNMLQACWGMGKGFYNASQLPIEYNCTNPLYRFKTVGYVIVPGEDNSHGLVKLIFNKKESEISNQKEALTNGILNILGNKPNLTVCIDHIKAISDNQSEVMFCVSEKGVTGSSRKIPALDMCAFLNQSMQKQQLTNVGVTYIGAYVTPTKSQLQEYLKNAPTGVESQMWQAAQADNPNPSKFMPTPLNGYSDLKKRLLCQQYETKLHQGYLNQVGNDIVELKKKHVNSVAKINDLKQKYAQLYHRLLQIIIKQEVTRKVGMALQPEEEMLKGRLEMITTQLGLPTQFKGQLHEIRCCIELCEIPESAQNQRYQMDVQVQEDIKQFLKMEQNGIAQLIKIINSDLKSLKLISDGLEKMLKK